MLISIPQNKFMAIAESIKTSFDPQPYSINTLKSFEEISKTAYSHGLEAIYAIEKIDLNSIRRISEPSPPKIVQHKRSISAPSQLEFDFGDSYRGWMESFGSQVDFLPLLRSFMSAIDRKKAFLCLKPYHLENHITLTPLEKLEIERLSMEKRADWIQETQRTLRIHSTIKNDLSKIVNVFLKPWISRRLGIATKSEIMERLQKVSENPKLTLSIMEFLESTDNSVYTHLNKVDDRLFCSDDYSAINYSLILEVAHSYLYNSEVCYNLPHLVRLITHEFARNWQGFNEGFVEKVLRRSSHFLIRKQKDNSLIIGLAL